MRTIDRILYSRYNKLSESELRQIVEDEHKLGHFLSLMNIITKERAPKWIYSMGGQEDGTV